MCALWWAFTALPRFFPLMNNFNMTFQGIVSCKSHGSNPNADVNGTHNAIAGKTSGVMNYLAESKRENCGFGTYFSARDLDSEKNTKTQAELIIISYKSENMHKAVLVNEILYSYINCICCILSVYVNAETLCGLIVYVNAETI